MTRAGAQLELNGQPFRFTGVNAYEIATWWGRNAGCGGMLDDPSLDTFFASLRPGGVVRIWAWQGSMATNFTTKTRDWGPLDRVVNAAQRNGQRLILSLGSQGGDCDDGHWKDMAWYGDGYRQVFNDDGRGLNITSYGDYVNEIVTRYASSPTVAMWEPVNEPETSTCPAGLIGPACQGHLTCPDEAHSAAVLRGFFDAVGQQIKRIDANHLVESGVIGGGQCGASGNDFAVVHASPGIDVGSYHDYGQDAQPMPGDQWNGLAVRISQLRALAKPIIVGEVGIRAGRGVAGCATPEVRASELQAKLNAQMAAGVAGVLPWDWVPQAQGGCSYDVLSGDPVLAVMRGFAL